MRGRSVIGLAAASLGVALAAAPNVAPQGRIYGHDNIKRHVQKWGRSRQQGNSPAGYSHEHKREIARRLRQAERDRAKREARMLATFAYLPASKRPEQVDTGLSRRGLPVPL